MVFMSGCGPAPVRELPTSFWVWNRDEPPSAEEQQGLRSAGVGRLFWQVGELELLGRELAWKEQHPLPADTATLRFVPTIRIHASAASPSQWADSLVERVKPFQEFQLDFDCRTNRLQEYQEALHRLRAALPGRRLSITALAHWPQAAHWRELMQEVDEVFPMFYDLEPDLPLKAGARPRPMIDTEVVLKWAKAWKRCPVPWHLGLPNMTRLTVFSETGGKHLRSWDQTTVGTLGAPLLREGAALTLWQSAEDGRFTALRRPAAADMQSALAAGRDAGAAGAIWFSLPQPGRAARGWSVAHLRHLATGVAKAPSFKFATSKVEGGYRLMLTNTGDQDVIDDVDGCLLRLKVTCGEVREVLAGAFANAAFFASGAQVTDPRDADEVRLSFARLDAGESMATDLARFSFPKTGAGLSWTVESATIKGEMPTHVSFDE